VRPQGPHAKPDKEKPKMADDINSKSATSSRESLHAVFAALQQILSAYKSDLAVKIDRPGNCYLETRAASLNGRRLFFAGAKIKKNYVSFYLTPLYMFPDLAYGISPCLSVRMQGQSCFNFTVFDQDGFDELDKLTEAAFQKIKDERLL
jgi:hypothetical protein